MRHLFGLLVLAPFAFSCAAGGKDDGDTDVTDSDTDINSCAGIIDDCGVCDGDNADMDCDGECFGDAEEDLCGTCDDDDSNDCPTSFAASGAWACETFESCQDEYSLELNAGTTITVALTTVTGGSVPRLGLFGPDVDSTSTNLLTNTPNDNLCVNQDEDDGVTYTVTSDGVYTLTVGRDWDESSGGEGTYALAVDAPAGIPAAAAVLDDVASHAAAWQCGYTWSVAGAWACTSLESCRDVYDLDLPAGVELSLELTDVTGSSVPMLALYAPGVGLDGVNAITNQTTDFVCTGPDMGLEAGPVVTDAAGVWRVAVGRDWDDSSGTSGTYTLTVREVGGYANATQTASDVDSEATGNTCASL